MSEERTTPLNKMPPAPEQEIKGILPQIESATEEPVEETAELPTAKSENSKSIDAMLNVGMNIQVILGYSRMPISDLLTLGRGSVIELGKKIGEPVDVIVNQSLVARGDLIKVGDNNLGISLTEIVKDYILES